jgi:hypothetical protein
MRLRFDILLITLLVTPLLLLSTQRICLRIQGADAQLPINGILGNCDPGQAARQRCARRRRAEGFRVMPLRLHRPHPRSYECPRLDQLPLRRMSQKAPVGPVQLT